MNEESVSHADIYTAIGRIENKLDRNTTVLKEIQSRVGTLEFIEKIHEGEHKAQGKYARIGKWVIGTLLAFASVGVLIYNSFFK